MTSRTEWRELALALRDLHRTLVERSRRDYEREHVVTLSAGEFLQLLTADPNFDWLRGLSELMVDIDVVRDADPQVMEELAGAVRTAVEHFITPPGATETPDAFAQRYWPYIQDDPHVAMAHTEVKRALASWPPRSADAADWLHERHRLAESARHRTRDG
ncbi:MAG: hypothetical protein ACXW2A_06275 [Burkholderiales bacterium]